MNSNSIEIISESDLRRLIKQEGIICNDINIVGENLKTLNGLLKINGSFVIADSCLESIGDLNEITGSFRIFSINIFSDLISLGKLEKVGGDVWLRYSNILDLGKLKEVGGHLNLRDTPLVNLGNLMYVGGDLHLPKRIKDKTDLTKMFIKGKVRYWNDSKNKIINIPKKALGLLTYPEGVPIWRKKYIYSIRELDDANFAQRYFYKVYKQRFISGEFLDVEGNNNYSFILYFDLLKEFSGNGYSQVLLNHLINLGLFYPSTKLHTQSDIIKLMENKNDYDSAWQLKYNEQNIKVLTIVEYEKKLNRDLLDGELIVKLGSYTHLTHFGQKNIANIKLFANNRLKTYQQEKGKKFFDLFFNNGIPYKSNSISQPINVHSFSRKAFNSKVQLDTLLKYDPEYYKQFFLSQTEFNHYKAIDVNLALNNYSSDLNHVVEKAIFNQCRLILKQAEDLYREANSMPKIGEGWISETELYYKIVTCFSEYEVIQHSMLNWLGRQHLDVFIPKFNIGIEYQGAQHYTPIDFFGGQEAFEKTKARDELKRKKCKANDCILIYVNEGYDFEELKNKIMEIIKERQSN